MATTMPGRLVTEPSAKLFFNGPFDLSATAKFRVTNKGEKKVGWAVIQDCYNDQWCRIEPPRGVLKPNESVIVTVTAAPFHYETDCTYEDQLMLEWTDTPADAVAFDHYWFKGNGIVSRHVIDCCFNV